MRHAAKLLAVALLSGCTSMVPKVTDPRAIGPRNDEWAATIAAPKADVYATVLRVLSDSAYGVAQTDMPSGVIVTRARKESEGQSGSAQARTMILGADWPVTLRLLISPAGDSTRVSIKGDYTHPDLSGKDAAQPIVAYQSEWKFVRGIGEALLARVQR
jgi:hypothetical protein